MAFNHVTKIDNLVPVRNVLVSLFDKAGIEAFAKGLLETCPGIRFYSTGGTYKALAAALALGFVKRHDDGSLKVLREGAELAAKLPALGLSCPW